MRRFPVPDLLRPDSALWRKAMLAGVHFGPDAWVRYSPPVFGLAFGAVLPEKRELVRQNLRRIHGVRPALVELADVAAVFRNYASCLTEALLLGAGRYRLSSRSRGVENYFRCAAEGKGVIIATAHTGGWEVAGPVLRGVHAGDVVVVMAPERDARARALQDEMRLRSGVKVVHVGDDPLGAIGLLHHLKRGAVVAMQMDRVPLGVRSRTASLFGQPWEVPEGPLQIAALSGAPILPVFTRRLGFMEYEAIASEPVRLPRRPSPAQLDAAAQQLLGHFESFLRENPTQWFHFV